MILHLTVNSCQLWIGKFLEILEMKSGKSRVVVGGYLCRVQHYRVRTLKQPFSPGELISVFWRSTVTAGNLKAPKGLIWSQSSTYLVCKKNHESANVKQKNMENEPIYCTPGAMNCWGQVSGGGELTDLACLSPLCYIPDRGYTTYLSVVFLLPGADDTSF